MKPKEGPVKVSSRNSAFFIFVSLSLKQFPVSSFILPIGLFTLICGWLQEQLSTRWKSILSTPTIYRLTWNRTDHSEWMHKLFHNEMMVPLVVEDVVDVNSSAQYCGTIFNRFVMVIIVLIARVWIGRNDVFNAFAGGIEGNWCSGVRQSLWGSGRNGQCALN